MTGTVGSSVTVGKACELGQIARLVLHGFMLRSGLGAPAVQLLTAALLFCPVRGATCLSEWGILRPFSTPAPEKVCCGSSSSESSWRERQTGRSAGSRAFELQALGSIRFLPIRLWGNVCFSSFSGPSNGVRDLTGRDSSLDPQLASCGRRKAGPWVVVGLVLFGLPAWETLLFGFAGAHTSSLIGSRRLDSLALIFQVTYIDFSSHDFQSMSFLVCRLFVCVFPLLIGLACRSFTTCISCLRFISNFVCH